LEHLSLAKNQFSGTLPNSWSSLVKVHMLELSSNQLTGNLPDIWSALVNLQILYLDDNQLTGSLPDSWTAFENLEWAALNRNQFTSLPDISGLSHLNYLNVAQNILHFGDIEPNIGIPISGFEYCCQAPIGEPQTLCKLQGEELRLSVTVGGQSNLYQWYKNGAIIQEATSALFVIPAVLPDDAGVYTCQITNTVATALTLTSQPITVSVNGNNNYLDVKVFLEGAYDPALGLMTTKLNTDPQTIPMAQPFNYLPWNYEGFENTPSIPAGIVDWVLVELRDAATPAEATPVTNLAGWPRAFLLKSDGTIVEPDGVSMPNICNPTVSNSLFVVIRHRNHLAVMSASGATLTDGVYSYDFTSGLAQAYGGESGYKILGSDAVMVAGDIDQDGNIFVSDYNNWAAGFGATTGYFIPDLDMDRNVFVSDYNKWAANFGTAFGGSLKAAGAKPRYFSSVPR
jgi:hypothetical protein